MPMKTHLMILALLFGAAVSLFAWDDGDSTTDTLFCTHPVAARTWRGSWAVYEDQSCLETTQSICTRDAVMVTCEQQAWCADGGVQCQASDALAAHPQC
jgi:hypothetical protein